MLRSVTFLLMAIGLLTACSGNQNGEGFDAAYSQSVGFTGIGFEPY